MSEDIEPMLKQDTFFTLFGLLAFICDKTAASFSSNAKEDEDFKSRFGNGVDSKKGTKPVSVILPKTIDDVKGEQIGC